MFNLVIPRNHRWDQSTRPYIHNKRGRWSHYLSNVLLECSPSGGHSLELIGLATKWHQKRLCESVIIILTNLGPPTPRPPSGFITGQQLKSGWGGAGSLLFDGYLIGHRKSRTRQLGGMFLTDASQTSPPPLLLLFLFHRIGRDNKTRI